MSSNEKPLDVCPLHCSTWDFIRNKYHFFINCTLVSLMPKSIGSPGLTNDGHKEKGIFILYCVYLNEHTSIHNMKPIVFKQSYERKKESEGGRKEKKNHIPEVSTTSCVILSCQANSWPSSRGILSHVF